MNGRTEDGWTDGRVGSETLIVVLRLMRIFVFLASAAIVAPAFVIILSAEDIELWSVGHNSKDSRSQGLPLLFCNVSIVANGGRR